MKAAITEEMTSHIGTIVIILLCLIIFFYLINNFTGGKLVRLIVCSIAFWLPFGAALGIYCQAIPV
jgi:predicted RND superfamily exporter protein